MLCIAWRSAARACSAESCNVADTAAEGPQSSKLCTTTRSCCECILRSANNLVLNKLWHEAEHCAEPPLAMLTPLNVVRHLNLSCAQVESAALTAAGQLQTMRALRGACKQADQRSGPSCPGMTVSEVLAESLRLTLSVHGLFG